MFQCLYKCILPFELLSNGLCLKDFAYWSLHSRFIFYKLLKYELPSVNVQNHIRGGFSAQNVSLFFHPVSRKDHHGYHLQYSLKDQKIHIGYTDTVMSKLHSETTLGEERYKGQHTKTEPSLTPLSRQRAFLCSWVSKWYCWYSEEGEQSNLLLLRAGNRSAWFRTCT